MIRLDRGGLGVPPEIAARGVADLDRIAGLRAAETLKSDDFDASIYAAAPIKDALWKAQHRKCCFCEQKRERAYASVEHFRPKTKARGADGRLEWGYWWLAYRIENLFFACMNCNGPKRDWFPVATGTTRTPPGVLPWSGAPTEQAMVVDPGHEDPEQHIQFVKHPVTGRWRIAARTERGEVTIRLTTLDRDDLDELRDDHLNLVGRLLVEKRDAAGPEGMEDVRLRARHAAAPNMPFALLMRCFLRAEGLL
jgi:uncharacterized protein (TIGR02646 family)